MGIKILKDNELKYEENIITGLRAYNTSQTGERKKDTYVIYVFENDTLVAGTTTGFGWDWAGLSSYFYQDRDALYALINEVSKYYKDVAQGIQINSFADFIIDDLQSAHFKIAGYIPNYPIGSKRMSLVNKEMKQLPTKKEYVIKTSNEEIEEYKEILKKEVDLFNTKYNVASKTTNLQFVCFDDDKFIGGVSGYIGYDNLGVNFLYVDKAYRGKDIGTKLMNVIEEEAKKLNIPQSYLGTASFQARGFYEKLGYNVVTTIKDYPKGFEVYTLVKKL